MGGYRWRRRGMGPGRRRRGGVGIIAVILLLVVVGLLIYLVTRDSGSNDTSPSPVTPTALIQYVAL
jgi:hypothetical protein